MAVRFIDKGPSSLAETTGSRALAWLIAINLGFSLIIWGCSLFSHGEFNLEIWLGLPSGWSNLVTRPWSLFTYMVTQTGVLHLLFNLLWLYFFGRIGALAGLEEKLLLFLYIGGGITGGLFFLLWTSIIPISFPLLGSSAAVMALIAYEAVRNPQFQVNLWLFGRVPLVAIAVVSIFLTFLGAGGGNSGGQAAHLGGLFFGLGTGWMIRSGNDPSLFLSKIGEAINSRRAVRRQEKGAKRRRADETLLTGIRGRLADRERLDELLDKIRASGYSSLTGSERTELNALSNRLSDY